MGGQWGVGVRNILYQIEVTIRKTVPVIGTGAEQERSLRSAQPSFLAFLQWQVSLSIHLEIEDIRSPSELN